MILNLYDSSFAALGKLQRFDSLQWLRSWSGCGEFILELTGTNDLLARGVVVKTAGDMGIIEQLTIAEDGKSGEKTTVRGRPLLSLLSRRIVLQDFTLNGQIEDVLSGLITANLRGLNFAIDVVSGAAGVTLDYSIQAGANLLDAVTTIAENGGIGLFVDVVDNVPTLTIKHAVIRQGVFTSENGTLLSKEYDEGDMDMRNVCYACCNDLCVVYGDAAGIDRHEHYITASVDKTDDGGTRTQAEQEALLLDKAAETLAGLGLVRTLSAAVNPYGQLAYGVDYDLGDYLTVKAPKWGVSMIAQATSIKEIYDGSGYLLEVTFGNQYLSTTNRIKKGVA